MIGKLVKACCFLIFIPSTTYSLISISRLKGFHSKSLSLESKFSDHQFIKIINNDIMKIFNKINIGKNIIVFGNLPYNISTQILASLC